MEKETQELINIAFDVDISCRPVSREKRQSILSKHRGIHNGVNSILANIICYGSIAIEARLAGNIDEALAWEKAKETEYKLLPNNLKW